MLPITPRSFLMPVGVSPTAACEKPRLGDRRNAVANVPRYLVGIGRGPELDGVEEWAHIFRKHPTHHRSLRWRLESNGTSVGSKEAASL